MHNKIKFLLIISQFINRQANINKLIQVSTQIPKIVISKNKIMQRVHIIEKIFFIRILYINKIN